jgi:hypothetical protein
MPALIPKLVIMNPPKGSRSRLWRSSKKPRRSGSAKSKPTAAQIRARKLFAKRFGRPSSGISKSKRPNRSESGGLVPSKGPSVPCSRRPVRSSTVATPKNRRRRRYRFRRSSGIASSRGFIKGLPFTRDMLPVAAGIVGASVIAPYLTSWFGGKLIRTDKGLVDSNRYLIGKALVGTALSAAAAAVGQKKPAAGMALGTMAMVAYDLLIRAKPSLAPSADPVLPPPQTGNADYAFVNDYEAFADYQTMGDYPALPVTASSIDQSPRTAVALTVSR